MQEETISCRKLSQMLEKKLQQLHSSSTYIKTCAKMFSNFLQKEEATPLFVSAKMLSNFLCLKALEEYCLCLLAN